jgi:hypothetical protein
LSNPVNVTVADLQGMATIMDDDPVADLQAGRELAHGFQATFDLAAQPGPVSDQDWFRIGQEAHASYEVTVDAAGGDTRPLQLQRVACGRDHRPAERTDVGARRGPQPPLRERRRRARDQ